MPVRVYVNLSSRAVIGSTETRLTSLGEHGENDERNFPFWTTSSKRSSFEGARLDSPSVEPHEDIRFVACAASLVTRTRRSWWRAETRDKRNCTRVRGMSGRQGEIEREVSRQTITTQQRQQQHRQLPHAGTARVDDNYNNNCNYVGGNRGWFN